MPSRRSAADRPRATTGQGLSSFLDSLERPVSFLRQAPSHVLTRATLPAAELATRAHQLRGSVRDGRVRDTLESLAAALNRWAETDTDDRGALLDQVAAIIATLRGGHSAVRYVRRDASVAADLQALAQSVQFVPAVGPRRAETLRKFGLATVEDLLYHLPFRYEDRRSVRTIRELRVGEAASAVGELTHLAERHVGRTRRRILEGVLRDETGFLALTWFHQVAYFKSRYQKGQRCVVHGKVEGAPGGQKRIVHPEVVPESDLEGRGVLPVYLKPSGMHVQAMRQAAAKAVAGWAERLPSVLPEDVAAARGLMDLAQAMRALHVPDANADVDALNECRSRAHRSLVFDELFFLQLGMALRRRRLERERGVAMQPSTHLAQQLRRALPFRLTVAQERAIHEIDEDMKKPHPMQRLVQGDVGSGKTLVAVFAALTAIENGHQVALMAPTELLAEQHAATLRGWLEPLGIALTLLVGPRRKSERTRALADIAAGEVPLVVGTHAVIQETVRFARLGLGIVDEQHRFGVLQRAALRDLGTASSAEHPHVPHMLLMTATPIPRTLAMSVYGDLDLSVLDHLPPGRKPIRTFLYGEHRRGDVYDMVKRAVDAGRQAYVVFPLVEESPDLPLRDATSMAEELARAVFHGYRVGLLHGRMKPAEKEAVMMRFKAGELQVLVSTTVIEVGIDVPRATVMVIEHAERFGLAQLHQLRGRVGRGEEQSYCFLLAPFRRGDDAHRRLTAMVETNDGFRIADVDLEIRGPGDLLGTRQSGLPDFRVANLIRDRALLEDARKAADDWLQRDPTLELPASEPLRRVLAHRWAGRLGLADIA